VASLLPEEFSKLATKMSEKHAQRLLDEFDEPLNKLARKIGSEGRVKVIEYLDKIETMKSPPLKELANAIGKGEVARFLYYVDNREYLENYLEPPFLSGRGEGAVLRRRDIEHLCSDDNLLPLIDPAYKDCFEAASYKLRLGSRYRVKGVRGWLTQENRELRIPPHGIAIVSTYEWLNIPGFLIARWNLKVRKVYNGLVWVGSLQVDPGYQGFLSCPLYNLSTKEQILEYDDRDGLFVIDFVKTTAFEPSKGDLLWKAREENRLATFDFGRLDKAKIESAPEYLKEEVDQCKREIGDFKRETHFTEFLGMVVLTIIVAALGIIVSFKLTTSGGRWTSNTTLIVLISIALAMGFVSLMTSIFWVFFWRQKEPNKIKRSRFKEFIRSVIGRSR